MNPGYLAYILISIAMILLASGWKNELCGNVSHRALLFFFIAWIPLSFAEVRWPGLGRVNLCLLLVLFLCIYGFKITRQNSQRVYLFAIGFFLAFLYFMMEQLFVLDPLLIVYRAQLDVCLILSLAVFIFLKDPLMQIAAISIGMLLGSILNEFFIHGVPHVLVGGFTFQDEWWLTVLIARGMTLVGIYSYNVWKEMTLLIDERMKGWRK